MSVWTTPPDPKSASVTRCARSASQVVRRAARHLLSGGGEGGNLQTRAFEWSSPECAYACTYFPEADRTARHPPGSITTVVTPGTAVSVQVTHRPGANLLVRTPSLGISSVSLVRPVPQVRQVRK